MFWGSDDEKRARERREADARRLKEDQKRTRARVRDNQRKVERKKKLAAKQALIEAEMERLIQGSGSKEDETKKVRGINLLQGALSGSFAEAGPTGLRDKSGGSMLMSAFSYDQKGKTDSSETDKTSSDQEAVSYRPLNRPI